MTRALSRAAASPSPQPTSRREVVANFIDRCDRLCRAAVRTVFARSVGLQDPAIHGVADGPFITGHDGAAGRTRPVHRWSDGCASARWRNATV
jgi:hypothetical protein